MRTRYFSAGSRIAPFVKCFFQRYILPVNVNQLRGAQLDQGHMLDTAVANTVHSGKSPTEIFAIKHSWCANKKD